MAERIQTVVFVRHGVALHNLGKHSIDDSSMVDPPLVEMGKFQAVRAGEKVTDWMQGRIDLIVVSPLSRCIDTAIIGLYPGRYDQPSPPPIVCHEDIREVYGIKYSDKRREKSTLERFWGRIVEFPSTMTEHDEDWSRTYRETIEDVDRRIQNFLEWMVAQTADRVVVVSHGKWIKCLLLQFGDSALPRGTRVHNADAYKMNLHSKDGTFFGASEIDRIYSSHRH